MLVVNFEMSNTTDKDRFLEKVKKILPQVTITWLQSDHIHHKFIAKAIYPIDLMGLGVIVGDFERREMEGTGLGPVTIKMVKGLYEKLEHRDLFDACFSYDSFETATQGELNQMWDLLMTVMDFELRFKAIEKRRKETYNGDKEVI
jgi:hypothetical protein